MRRFVTLLSLASLVTAAACGDDGGGGSPDAPPGQPDAPTVDAEPGPDANPNMPGTLAETGLCVDAACMQISPDVREYTPAYALWSDGATKRRWIYLPPGTQIDTTEMDYWNFPEGTKLWKEFTRDDVRVETRIIQKIGPNPEDWYLVSFAWNEAQDEAVAVPIGVPDALGTDHDIPSRSDCRKCHDRLQGKALGFGAIQLDHDGPGVTLASLVADDLLTSPPASNGAGEAYFPLPGDATTHAAIGYLHANCGGCHNPTTDIASVAVDFRLRVGALTSIEATPVWNTAVGVPNQLTLPGATAIIEPSMPSASAAYLRLTSTQSSTQMPPIGRELVDDTGAAAVAAWITSLTP